MHTFALAPASALTNTFSPSIKTPFNFLEKEANDRLIAAIIRSVDNNISFKEISRFYGDSVGFNTIEWYIRKLRHQAIALKAEADGDPVPPAKGKAKKTGAAAGVKTGRVRKNKKEESKVKKEVVEEQAEEMLHGDGADEEEEELQTEI